MKISKFTSSLLILIPVLIIIALVSGAAYQLATVKTTTLTPHSRERVCTGGTESTSCKWMVFSNKGPFINSDALYHLKFDSSDIHNDLVLDQPYEVVYYGFRVPFLSVYPNIVSVSKQ